MPTQNVLNQIVINQNGLTATYKIGDIIEGYYDSTTGKFYEESTHTTEIQGASGFLYVDLGNNDIYIYKTSTSSFVKVSGSGGTADNIKFGYLNHGDGKFYEDDSYTVEIPADATKIYIDLAEDTIYRYDATNTEYVSIGGGGGGTTYTAGFGININSEDEISTTDFVGTQAQWNALTPEQKAAYDIINITDDTTSISYKPGHSISDGTTEKTQRDGLVFDGFSVTDDSTNEVTKIAEIPYTAGDGIEITNKEVSVGDEISRTWTGTQAQWDAIVDKSPYDGWIINITDDAGAGVGPVVDVVEDGNMNAVTSNAVYNIAQNKMSYVDNGILGAKNLTPSKEISQTKNGIVFVVDSNGIVTLNQTADNTIFRSTISDNNPDNIKLHLKAGSYIYSLCDANISGVSIVVKDMNNVDVLRTTTLTGATFTLAEDKDVTIDWRIETGTSFSNTKFKAMIRLATDSDPTYQPYAMTNRELTDNAGSPKKMLIRTLANGKITATIPKNLGSSYTQGSLKLIGSNADSEAHVTFCLNSDNTAVSVSKLTNLGSKALTLDNASISGNNLILEISGVQSYAWVSAEYFMSLSAGASAVQPIWTFTGS